MSIKDFFKFTGFVKMVYKAYFDVKLGDQDKS